MNAMIDVDQLEIDKKELSYKLIDAYTKHYPDLEFFIHDHHIDPSNTLLVNHINRGIVNSPSHQEAE